MSRRISTTAWRSPRGKGLGVKVSATSVCRSRPSPRPQRRRSCRSCSARDSAAAGAEIQLQRAPLAVAPFCRKFLGEAHVSSESCRAARLVDEEQIVDGHGGVGTRLPPCHRHRGWAPAHHRARLVGRDALHPMRVSTLSCGSDVPDHQRHDVAVGRQKPLVSNCAAKDRAWVSSPFANAALG